MYIFKTCNTVFFFLKEQSLDSNFTYKIISCLWNIVATSKLTNYDHNEE